MENSNVYNLKSTYMVGNNIWSSTTIVDASYVIPAMTTTAEYTGFLNMPEALVMWVPDAAYNSKISNGSLTNTTYLDSGTNPYTDEFVNIASDIARITASNFVGSTFISNNCSAAIYDKGFLRAPIPVIPYVVDTYIDTEQPLDIKVTIPDTVLPNINLPTLNVPDIKIPDQVISITIPEIVIPDIVIPEILIPTITIPDIVIPPTTITIPEIQVPEVSIDVTYPKTTVNIKRSDFVGITLADVAIALGKAVSNGNSESGCSQAMEFVAYDKDDPDTWYLKPGQKDPIGLMEATSTTWETLFELGSASECGYMHANRIKAEKLLPEGNGGGGSLVIVYNEGSPPTTFPLPGEQGLCVLATNGPFMEWLPVSTCSG